MKKFQKVTLILGMGIAIVSKCFTLLPAKSQSIISANDGTNTRVNTQGNLIDITGGSLSRDGANLFHSFQQLNVPTGTTANFIASPNVQNILGRVVGGNPSLINGLLQVTGSNSNLYIINPAGIVFGTNATLNVPAAFTATTANQIGFGNNNWLTSFGTNNYQNLTGTPNQFLFNTPLAGSIVNTGNLTLTPGQNLTLLGGAVLNTGNLVSLGGNITVMAVPGTNLVRLSQPGNILSLEVVPPENGIITPLSLPQLLTGNSNITGVNLSPDGTLPLGGFDTPLDRGNIVITGRINTVNRNVNLPLIPRVQILGDRIALFNTIINASSVYGGGTVLIGGEYLGQGIIPTAQFTFADTNTRVRANGIVNANGGRVIAWANNTTRFFGAINARGGNVGGNGGFIETSGKLSLDVSGIRINASSAFGSPGLWLLDPIDINISGAATSGGTFSVPTGLFTSDNIAPTANILASDIIASLNAGTDVTLITNQGPIGGNGDINVNAILNINPPASGATLSLLATRDININAAINATGGFLNINLLTPTIGNINVSGTINTRGGNFAANLGGTFTASGSIATSGGNFTVNANNSFTATNSISTLSTTGNSGDINIRARNGSITTQELRSSNTLIGRVAGSVTLNAPIGISVGTINSSRTGAGSGSGNFINITTEGLFRANNFLATPPICAGASLCSYGNANSGKITIQHGGGMNIPFVVGGATNNGTLGGIYSSGLLSSMTIPVPPAENSYFAGNTTIITSVPPPPIPPAPLPLEIFSLLRNPEAPPTPPPVIVGTPPTIEPVADAVPEPQPIPFASPIPIHSPSLSPLATSLPIPPPEILPLPVSLPSPNLTPEQFSQFARDFQDRRSQLPLLENTLSLNSEVSSAIIYIFFSKPSVVGRVNEPGQVAVVRSSLSPSPEDQLEIMVVFERGDPLRKTSKLTRREVINLANDFRSEVTAYRTSPRGYITPSQQLYAWLIAPIEKELQEKKINNLNFILDQELRSLPLAALHDGQGFLIENYSVAMMPSLNLTDLRSSLASLWTVGDEPTLDLMTNFYEQLTSAPIKSEAVRHIQLAMLRRQIRLESGNLVISEGRSIPLSRELAELGNRDFSHPYFWSAFTLVGNPW